MHRFIGSLFHLSYYCRRVGREAECTVTYNGTRATRKVLLETDELILRGDPRVMVRRKDITRVEAVAGTLLVSWDGGAAKLALGPDATKWANDILNPKTRIDKLGVKAGQKVALVGVMDDALPVELAKVGAVISKARKDLDVVFVQIDSAKTLTKIASAAKTIARAGAIWALTPRGVDGLKDTDVMKAAKAAGLVDVKVVRFSDTHSANKFVIPAAKR